MSTSVLGRLILKDFYLAWPVIAGSMVLGFAMLGLALFGGGQVTFYVGSVSFICVLILLNVFLVSSTVAQEKKDRVILFVLSLPVSTTQYALTKLASSLLAFVIPFVMLGAAALLMIGLTAIPHGLIPLTVAVMMYVYLYFCIFLAVALAADSAVWNTVVIICGNVMLNFLIAWLLNRPAVGATAKGPVAVWSSEIIATLAVEFIGSVVALAAALLAILRKKDFV
ncbi:MAG TPA: ABC-2 transporter permease [Steroidobacteraceae bacterium]|nr:ABC-2 transporter permease [Steroidobacteraceae bacterium]